MPVLQSPKYAQIPTSKRVHHPVGPPDVLLFPLCPLWYFITRYTFKPDVLAGLFMFMVTGSFAPEGFVLCGQTHKGR